MAEELLQISSHGLCHVKRLTTGSRRKRQAFAFASFIGGLIFGPLLERLFDKRDDGGKLSKYLDKVKHTEVTTRHRLDLLENRIRRLERVSDAESSILSLLGLSAIERATWSDLRSPDSSTNHMTSSLLTFALLYYKKHNFLKDRKNSTITQPFSLPKPTWRISVRTARDQSCAKAMVMTDAVALLPSKECEEVVSAEVDKTITKTSGGGCRILGPIANSVELDDNSLFIMTNSYSKSHGVCGREEDIKFITLNGSLLMNVESGSATVSCGKSNSGASLFKTQITRPSTVGVPYGCSGFISNSDRGARVFDYFQQEVKILNGRGSDLEAGANLQSGLYTLPEDLLKTNLFKPEQKNSSMDDSSDLDGDYEDVDDPGLLGNLSNLTLGAAAAAALALMTGTCWLANAKARTRTALIELQMMELQNSRSADTQNRMGTLNSNMGTLNSNLSIQTASTYQPTYSNRTNVRWNLEDIMSSLRGLRPATSSIYLPPDRISLRPRSSSFSSSASPYLPTLPPLPSNPPPSNPPPIPPIIHRPLLQVPHVNPAPSLVSPASIAADEDYVDME